MLNPSLCLEGETMADHGRSVAVLSLGLDSQKVEQKGLGGRARQNSGREASDSLFHSVRPM